MDTIQRASQQLLLAKLTGGKCCESCLKESMLAAFTRKDLGDIRGRLTSWRNSSRRVA